MKMKPVALPQPEPTVWLHMVCGRNTHSDPAYFPQVEHEGMKIIFCTEACLSAFRSDPDRFYAVHSKSDPST